MSVVVRGMEMPESCGRCWFNNSSLSCAITGSCIDRDDENKERLYDCPLGDLGKHGKLIDADKLEPDADYDDGEFWAYSVAQVCSAQTIIEAEDSADGI